MNTTSITTLAEVLESRIVSMCRKYGPMAEDIAQHVRATLVEKMLDPHFASQQVGYHIRFAKWTAQKAFDACRTYDKYVGEEPVVQNEDGETASYFEDLCAAPGQDVEQIIIERETAREIESVLAGLTPQQAKVARLLVNGYSQAEIVAQLHMSKSSVSHIVTRMQAAMRAALAL
jgi:RNA polymerase sigma factor (sigma-70 family)